MPCINPFFSAGGGSLPAKDWPVRQRLTGGQAGAYGGSNSFGEEPIKSAKFKTNRNTFILVAKLPHFPGKRVRGKLSRM